MEINNRADISRLINEIEIKYPVNEWMHNGYHIWPVLRVPLYMHLIRMINGNKNQLKPEVKFNRLSRIWDICSSYKDLLLANKGIDRLYVGAPSHCINYQGKSYNRYFDLLMDQNDNNSLYIDYGSISKENKYKPERTLLLSNLIKGYKIYRKKNKSDCQKIKYVAQLNDILNTFNISIENYEENLFNYIKNVDISYSFSKWMLKILKPKEVMVLCYYGPLTFGLNIACHELSITSIDFQHGGQGRNHLAYNSWRNIPIDGYEALPDFFYTWDEISAKSINKWADTTGKHKAVKFGNPWVEEWKNGKFKSEQYEWPNNLILYTLQPVKNPLEDYLLETIDKTKEKWTWWLRLHPRQLDHLENIKERLIKYDLLDHVNIENATQLQLPEILAHTQIHLTKFSGCAIEAYQFKVPTILIDNRGKELYEEYEQMSDLVYSYLKKDSDELINKISLLKK